jgi:hypothetical protein
MTDIMSSEIKKVPYQNSDFPGRHNLDARWELIENILPKESNWFLDIGSNNADTLKRLTAKGHFGVGLEVDKDAAAKTLPDNAAMMITEVNAETFVRIPRFFGMFLLSVFHRIWALQGPDSAKDVLKAAGENSDFLIMEGCSRHARYTNKSTSPAPEFTDMNIQDSMEWHINLLTTLIPGSSVSFIGVTKTVRTNDPRPLFAIKTNSGKMT